MQYHLYSFFLFLLSYLLIVINLFQSEFKQFVEEFTRLLKYSLVHGDKQPAVERTLSFVVKFATSEKVHQEEKERANNDEDEDEADPFLENLIVFLLKVKIWVLRIFFP